MGVEYLVFLIPIVAILAWGAIEVTKNLTGGGGDADELRADLAAFADELDEAQRERDRLRARVENLEAIAAAEPAPPLLDLDALPDPEADRAAAERRRTRA